MFRPDCTGRPSTRDHGRCNPVETSGKIKIALAKHHGSSLMFLNDGNKMPTLALGTGRGTARPDEYKDLVRQAVFDAIEIGYRHIDTAAIYDDEAEVGKGINAAMAHGLVTREDLFITTKLWNNRHARKQVVPALRESLERLGLQYVDLYLIHFPMAVKFDDSPDDIDYVETWKGMRDAKSLGLTKSIGVSNFNMSQIDRLLQNTKDMPAVNQIEVNPTNTQEELVRHCQGLGIAVMAYSPFGFLVNRKASAENPKLPADYNIIDNMGTKYNKTREQIALRYLLDRALIPIPKSTNKKRIQQNIDIFDFSLTEREVEQISKYNRNVRVITMSAYRHYPNYPFFDTKYCLVC